MARNTDTPEATATRPAASGVPTEYALGAIVIGAVLALAGIRIGFRGAVIELGG